MSTDVALGTRPAPWPPSWGSWVAACTIAELLGMVAASAAAVGGSALAGDRTGVVPALLVLGLALLGGAAEGFAVGELQFRVLLRWLPELSRRRYVGATVLLAVAFWTMGMTPSTVLTITGASAGATAAPDPAPWLVAVVAAVGGAVGGAAFGLVQGAALRGHVPHPWHWVRPNVVGWALAVAVITVGATSVPTGLSGVAVLGYGVVVGIAAGACIGVVTGQALPSLECGLPWWNRVVVGLLCGPLHRVMSHSLVLLRFRGRRTGALVTLPVQYAAIDATTLVVYAADAGRKTWWRSFREAEHPVEVRLRGAVRRGTGRVLGADDPAYAVLAAAYAARQPRVMLPADATLLRLTLGP